MGSFQCYLNKDKPLITPVLLKPIPMKNKLLSKLKIKFIEKP